MTEPEALRQRRQDLLETIGRAADEIRWIDDRISSLLEGRRSSMKGKSKNRNARMDLLRRDAANARRRTRKRAAYDRRQYDKLWGEES